jgi:Domain of unknown function (DUF222)
VLDPDAARVAAEVVIHIGFDTINRVPGAPKFGESVDGSPVPAETVRRHACDANISPVVLDGDGLPLDVGRAQRLATPSQRTALRSKYRTCAVDGCNTNSDRCEIHNILEWTDHRGPTDLRYLIPACTYITTDFTKADGTRTRSRSDIPSENNAA